MPTGGLIADIALLVGLPGLATPKSEPHVPGLGDVHDVLAVLHTPQARNSPSYVLSVLRSYVRPRATGRRRARTELDSDLALLAAACPEFAPELRAIIKHYRLPLPASMLPPQAQAPQATAPSPREAPPPNHSPYHTLPRARLRPRPSLVPGPSRPAPPRPSFWAHMPLTGIARVTSATEAADPPPPYASDDPHPHDTAVMALQLAAQSRIGLGDLAALAATSRVDIVELAERSQLDLSRLAGGEDAGGTGAGAEQGRERQRRRASARVVSEPVGPARSQVELELAEWALRRHTEAQAPPMQPSQAPPQPQAEADTPQRPQRRIVPRRQAPRPPRTQTPPRPPRAPDREAAAARQEALRRLEQRAGAAGAGGAPPQPQTYLALPPRNESLRRSWGGPGGVPAANSGRPAREHDRASASPNATQSVASLSFVSMASLPLIFGTTLGSRSSRGPGLGAGDCNDGGYSQSQPRLRSRTARPPPSSYVPPPPVPRRAGPQYPHFRPPPQQPHQYHYHRRSLPLPSFQPLVDLDLDFGCAFEREFDDLLGGEWCETHGTGGQPVARGAATGRPAAHRKGARSDSHAGHAGALAVYAANTYSDADSGLDSDSDSGSEYSGSDAESESDSDSIFELQRSGIFESDVDVSSVMATEG